MKARPLCVVCLLFLIAQSILFIMTGGESLKEIPASSVFFENESETVIVQGQVYQKRNTSNYQVLYLKNNSVQDSQLLIYDDKFTEISIGEIVRLRGTTAHFETARNPGNFDQALYYARQGFYGAIWCDKILNISGETNRYQEALFQIKAKWQTNLKEVIGEENGAILAAMLLGEKGEMDADVKELYQKNGIGHILAISGLHISFIGLGIYKLIRKSGLGYLPAGMISIGILSMYVGMIGLSVSVFRAFVMLLLKIGADITGRVYDMLTALMLSAALTVAYEPLYLTDGGFYMSYGAIIGIIFVLPALWKHFSFKKKFVHGGLASIAVNILLFPILLYFYFEVPVYSVLLNMVVIPLMSLLLGCGMVGSMLALFFAPLGNACLWICSMILEFYEWICHIGSRLPISRIVFGQPELWEVFLYYVCLAGILYYVYRRKKPKRAVWLFLGIAILFLGTYSRGELEVTMLDVGQGDCIFLQGPEGSNYLIDGGSSDVNEPGKYRIEPFLKSRGVGELDYVFVTHGDLDHYSGIEEMLDRQSVGVKINYLVLPVNFRQDEILLDLADTARNAGTKVLVMRQGECLKEDKLKITCVQPAEKEKLTGNAGSLVLEISFGVFSMLCTGDVEEEGEERLLQKLKGKDYDILKVAHHGSKNSTSDEFLQTINPEIALISSGKENSYGHPHEETLKRLEDAGCKIYQTTKNGAITLRSDGNALTISLFPL